MAKQQQQQQQQRIYLKKYKVYNTSCPANSYNANLRRTSFGIGGGRKNMRQRHDLGALKAQASGKNLKTGPLRMYFQHSGVKIRVFQQNTDITEFF